MKCPLDEETLVITERQGIEIDYCPRCRGVWLDRGELDKLIERAPDTYEGAPRRERDDRGDFASREAPYRRDRDDDDDDDDDRHRMHGGKRKKKGFLSEIFEMGG